MKKLFSMLVYFSGLLFSVTVVAESLYTTEVVFLKFNDPRHIAFTYPDGSELKGVHVGVTFDALWELRGLEEKQGFNLVYSKVSGLALSHKTKSIGLSLIGQVENHPMDIMLNNCYAKAMVELQENACKRNYDNLIEIEITRAYRLLKENDVDISVHKDAWKAFSVEQYKFMRNFYSKFTGSKWSGKNMNDIIATDLFQLNLLNSWVEASYANQDY